MFASGLEKNVCYERNRFMEKADNEMYALVDEEFLAKFSNQHLNYMKKLYYSFYAGYCKRIKRKPLTSEDFFRAYLKTQTSYINCTKSKNAVE